jgi:hypothetical protein
VLSQRFAYLVVETDGVGTWTIVDFGPGLSVINNLSDLGNVPAAVANLGLGTVALRNVGDFTAAANNLSELTDKAAARNNLALGPLATQNTITYSYLDPSMIATATDVANATPNKLIPANIVLGVHATVVLPFPASPYNTNWDFSTFTNGTYDHNAVSTITASNIPPGQTGFIIFHNTTSGGYLAINTVWPTQFKFVDSTNTISNTPGTRDLLEYWCESNSLIHCKITKGI